MAGAATLPKRKWKNLGVRFLSAMALLLVCLAPFYFGGWLWAGLVGLFGGRMLFEWVRMSHPAPRWTAYVAPILGFLAGVIYVVQAHFWFGALAVIVTIVSVVGLQAIRSGPDRSGRILWAGLGVAYIVIPCLLIIAMRGNFAGLDTVGFQRLLFIVVCVAAADVGAYFGGSIIGGPKLAPLISPNKTWSGFITGQLLAVILGAVVGVLVGIGGWNGAILALPVALLSVLGDLFESAIKRRLGVKDTGTLMPGHGGLLDRLDSLMAAVVGAAIMLSLFPSIWLG